MLFRSLLLVLIGFISSVIIGFLFGTIVQIIWTIPILILANYWNDICDYLTTHNK